MCMVVSYDIGSMFLISVFITICLSLQCLYTCLLRAHTSFMLSSGWTSFPSQDYFQGLDRFPRHCGILIGGHPVEDSAPLHRDCTWQPLVRRSFTFLYLQH